jgi:hypothetical protein
MDILAAIKREEKKLEKQLGKIQHQLNGVRAAAKALGDTANREVTTVKKRVLSAAARAIALHILLCIYFGAGKCDRRRLILDCLTQVGPSYRLL